MCLTSYSGQPAGCRILAHATGCAPAPGIGSRPWSPSLTAGSSAHLSNGLSTTSAPQIAAGRTRQDQLAVRHRVDLEPVGLREIGLERAPRLVAFEPDLRSIARRLL